MIGPEGTPDTGQGSMEVRTLPVPFARPVDLLESLQRLQDSTSLAVSVIQAYRANAAEP